MVFTTFSTINQLLKSLLMVDSNISITIIQKSMDTIYPYLFVYFIFTNLYAYFLSLPSKTFLGEKPTSVSSTISFLNIIMIGMLEILYFDEI